jgi:hypothetical protein
VRVKDAGSVASIVQRDVRIVVQKDVRMVVQRDVKDIVLKGVKPVKDGSDSHETPVGVVIPLRVGKVPWVMRETQDAPSKTLTRRGLLGSAHPIHVRLFVS